MHYVYILCCGDGSLYTGWTTNLKRRVTAHQTGKGAKYTRSHGPVELVYSEVLETKSDALKREAAIKKLPRTRKIELMRPWLMAEKWLATQGEKYIDAQEVLHRGMADIVTVHDKGVLLSLRTDEMYLLAAEDEETAQELLQNVSQDATICAHGRHCASAVKRTLGFHVQEECYLMAYLQETPPPKVKEVKISRLGAEYGPMVAREYRGKESSEYAMARVLEGAVYGAFDNGRLMGFVGTHTDGSMGMLEVLPDYRRQGLAQRLECFAIAQTMADNNKAFCYIEIGNTLSFKMQESVGMEVCGEKIYWMY